MTVPDATPEDEALGDVLLSPCGNCGHEPDEHGSRGCGLCVRCSRDATAVQADSVLASSWLAQRDARIKAEAVDEFGRGLADKWEAVRCGIMSPGLRQAADQIRAGIVQPPAGQIMGVNHDYSPGGPEDRPLRGTEARP